jgi:hypothetical protein
MRAVCPARRFPPPWSVDESPACLTVLDAGGRIAANIDVEENGTGRGWAM